MDNSADYDYEDIRYSAGPTISMSNPDKAQYTAFSTLEVMINWVNSFEYPSCLLASQIADLKDGIVFCELVNEIILKNQIPDFLPKIVSNDPNHDEKLHNATMALSEIKSMREYTVPQSIKELKSHELLQDENKIMILLKFLYDIANNKIAPNTNSQSSGKKPGVQTATEHNFISDSYNNRSDLYSNNSTQPSPISTISGPNSKMPQKPPLNPGLMKMKSPTNAEQPRKSEKVTQEHSPRHFDGSPIPMEYQERDTFSDIDITQTYANASGRRDQTKLPSDLYQQHYSSQTDYGYQQTFDYSPEFLTNDPHEGNGLETHHDFDGRESSMIVNDFSNLEMPRSTVPIEPSAGARRKSNKNISKSFSRHNERDYQQQNFVNHYAEYLERAQIEMHPSYESERYSYPFTTEIHNQSPFNPESQRTDQISSNRGLNESRIMPMEVQQQRRLVQQREEYDDTENSNFIESQQIYESAPNQKKRKSKSQAHYPAPEALEVNPNEYMNPEKKVVQPVQKKSENKEVMITPCSDDIKKKLLSWLCSIGLLKENIKGLDKKLPKVCKNGLLFIDLINRLEGKNETIKGITRNSKTKSQVNSNYFKIMEYLRGFEKMNPRYLQAQEYLLEGHEDVFWGFLDDLWSLYNHKISPFDPRYKVQKEKFKPKMITPKARTDSIKIADQLKVTNSELSYNDICCYNNPGTTTANREATPLLSTKDKSAPASKRLNSASKRQEYEDSLFAGTRKKSKSPPHYQEEDTSPQLYEPTKKTTEAQDDSAGLRVRQDSANNRMEIKTDFVNNSPKGKKASPMLDNFTPTTTKSVAKRYGSYSSNSPMCLPNKATQENIQFSTNEEQCISIDVEILVTDWLKQMGFKALLMRERKTLFDDPFRNGTLLCYVIGRVENEKMQGIYKEPKSIDECRSNVYKAFQVLRKKHIPIPSFLNGREESILKGSRSVTLTLLYSLMKTQKNKTGPSPITNSIEKGKYEVSSDIPPYSEAEIEQLELSLVNWLDGLGFLQGVSYRPTSIRELANHLKNGVILYDLASMITNEKLGSIHRRPTSEAHFLTNIRKALEILRNQKNMGQKYLWKEKEIFKGNKYIILGLLEDMQRFYDNMPPRKNPHYFSEGPYISKLVRKDDVQKDLLREKSKAAAFESALNHSVYARLNTSNYDNQSRIVPRETTMSSNYNATQANEELRTRNSVLNISSDEPISLMNNTRKSEIPFPSGSTTTSNKATERFSNLRSAPQSRRERGSEKGPRVSFVNENDVQIDMMERSPISMDKSTFAGGQFKEWLISLGLIDLVRYIDFDDKVIDEIKDGVVLCKIIEKLEMKEIPGVIVKPRTNASRMVNIRKCLNVLSKRPGVNPHYLHCEDKILAGDGPTVRKLLSSIKEAYKFVNKCIAKPRSRSSSRNLDSSIGELRNHQNIATPSELWNNRGTPDNFHREVNERKRMLIPTPKSKY